jgi:eukaryotic-like serine/threonine-protein kinase
MSQRFAPGTRVDRYEILEPLGEGAQGDVYVALHPYLEQRVAMKCLKLEQAQHQDMRDRFRLEARVLAQLRHPNVVQVLDGGVTGEGVAWLVMDLLEGQNLREVLRRVRRLGAAQTLYYAVQFAGGLAAAHARDVVHRDVKPENLFVTAENYAKLLDLGTAKFFRAGLKTTNQMLLRGTPAYASPEQLVGDAVDARSDVYSLGLVLYECLAGRYAYLDERGCVPSVRELVPLQLCADPPSLPQLLPDLPEFVWNIVRRAIKKDRHERWQNMAELAEELRRASVRLETEARAAGVTTLVRPLAEIPRLEPAPLSRGTAATAWIGARTERDPAPRFDTAPLDAPLPLPIPAPQPISPVPPSPAPPPAEGARPEANLAVSTRTAIAVAGAPELGSRSSSPDTAEPLAPTPSAMASPAALPPSMRRSPPSSSVPSRTLISSRLAGVVAAITLGAVVAVISVVAIRLTMGARRPPATAAAPAAEVVAPVSTPAAAVLAPAPAPAPRPAPVPEPAAAPAPEPAPAAAIASTPAATAARAPGASARPARSQQRTERSPSTERTAARSEARTARRSTEKPAPAPTTDRSKPIF